MSKLLHFVDNPFGVHPDTPKNKLLFENPLERYNQLITSDGFTIDLPDNDYEWCEIDLSNESQRKSLNEFINKFYFCTGSSARFSYIVDFMNDTHDAKFFVIKWKTCIIACFSIEIVDIFINEDRYKAFNGDFAIIHPKFRNKNLMNILMTRVFGEGVKNGCQMEFMQTHTNINNEPYLKRNVWNLSISTLPRMCNVTNKNEFISKIKKRVKLHELTLDEMREFNTRRYDVQVYFSDDRLEAMRKWYDCLGDDNGNKIILIPFDNVIDNVGIKTMLIMDIIIKSNGMVFVNECLKKCKKDGVDLVTVIEDSWDLIKWFSFEKNCVMNQHMLNYYPEVENKKINLTFR